MVHPSPPWPHSAEERTARAQRLASYSIRKSIEEMQVHPVLHPVGGTLACDDIADVRHRKDALHDGPLLCRGVTLDPVRGEDDVEVEWSVCELDEVLAGDDLALDRLIDNEADPADRGDETSAVVCVLRRIHIDVLGCAWKPKQDRAALADKQVVNAILGKRLRHLLSLKRIALGVLVHSGGHG